MTNYFALGESPEKVNKELVASTMDLLGHNRKQWLTVFWLTAFNVALAAFTAWAFIPIVGLILAIGAMVSGGLLLFWMWEGDREYREHTLQVRNALERRLMLPEYARHRQGYTRCVCE